MAVARAGRNARILIDTSPGANGPAVKVSNKNKWSIDQSTNTFETTAFEDLSKSYQTDLPDGKFTVEGQWSADDNLIYNVIGSSVGRATYIYPDAVNNITTYWFCTGLLSVKADGSIKDAVNFSLSGVAATPAQWVHP